jgi:hypothetical protein
MKKKSYMPKRINQKAVKNLKFIFGDGKDIRQETKDIETEKSIIKNSF